MVSLAYNTSKGKVGEEQECTVISKALQGSSIYRASALYYFIHRFDCYLLSRKNVKGHRNLALFCKHTWNHKAETFNVF